MSLINPSHAAPGLTGNALFFQSFRWKNPQHAPAIGPVTSPVTAHMTSPVTAPAAAASMPGQRVQPAYTTSMRNSVHGPHAAFTVQGNGDAVCVLSWHAQAQTLKIALYKVHAVRRPDGSTPLLIKGAVCSHFYITKAMTKYPTVFPRPCAIQPGMMLPFPRFSLIQPMM